MSDCYSVFLNTNYFSNIKMHKIFVYTIKSIGNYNNILNFNDTNYK